MDMIAFYKPSMVEVIVFRKRLVVTKVEKSAFSKEQELANALVEGIVVLDENAIILWWNTVAKHLLALRKEHVGLSIRDVLKGAGLRRLFLAPDEQITILKKSGRKSLNLLLSLIQYQDKKQLLTIQDVTQQRRAEMMRKDFIGNVSHELRTPLTVFRGYLELLSEQPEALVGQEKTVLDQMSVQCHRMETLINGVLLLSRLEDDEPDLSTHETVQMSGLIGDIVEDAKRLSQNGHEFVLEIDENLLLHGHPMELRSLFSNLIYNAVRHTPKPGVITVSWYKEGKSSLFRVKDTGSGIASKHLDKITQRFYRVDQSRPYHSGGGTGLGLAIVKHVLLRHDAELRIESSLGKGSTFSCVFPIIIQAASPDESGGL
jgi:two-component system phosphate regulon sensor histidine kinase PhoR